MAIDQALRCTGAAQFVDGKLMNYGTATVDHTGTIEQRLNSFYNALNRLVKLSKPDVVVMEDIQEQYSVSTFKTLAYVQAIVYLYCAQNGISVDVMSPSHWRKVLGGGFGRKRDEQKAHAIKLVKDEYRFDVESDVADAIGIHKRKQEVKRPR